MATSTMVEALDMPMIDYNEDGDIPMGGSSSENWIQPMSHMDEDVLNVAPSDALEIDMMAYEEVTTEYDMEDDAVQPQGTVFQDSHVIDTEVYDTTISASPLPALPVDVEGNYIVQPETLNEAGTLSGQPQGDHGLDQTTSHDSSPGSAAIQNIVVSDGPENHDILSAHNEVYHTEVVSVSRDREHNLEHPIDERDRTEGSASEEAVKATETPSSAHSEQSAHLEASDGSEDHPINTSHESPDPSHADPSSEVAREGQEGAPYERTEDQSIILESSTEALEANDYTDGAIQPSEVGSNQQTHMLPPPPPPPPIFLTLQVTSTEGDQPDFVLFNVPDSSSHIVEEPLVLLQHNPSLFYEPISAVFEAFRQEEYFSHLDELSEAEMALNAQELQLVISEDNIYAREVSLHDLYAMHQGVGLPGHLRLTLQSIIPRFIARYNILRDQITRLVLNEEVEEIQHPSDEISAIEQGHETEVNEDSTAPRVALEPDGHDPQSVEEGEHENSEGAHALGTSETHESRHTEDLTDETELNKEQTAQRASPVAPEGEHDEQELGDVHEDDFGEDDEAGDDFDADAIHDNFTAEGTEPTIEEHATPYHDSAENLHEDEYLDEAGNEEREIKAEAEKLSAPPLEDDMSHASVHDESAEVEQDQNNKHPEAISHSTSTSSFGTDDSGWEDEVEEVNASPDLQQETDYSTQNTTTAVYDEEGNDHAIGDDDDFGDDDFGDDDFDDSAEDTLQDPTEDIEELVDVAYASEEPEQVAEADAASQAVLAESENFVSELASGGDNPDAIDVKNALSETIKSGNLDQDITAEMVSTKRKAVHKTSSKRSLDDADLDDEEPVLLPSSPDPKRTRTL